MSEIRTLDRAAFEAWLRGFAPDAVVGASCDSQACPIARFIISTGVDSKQVSVDCETIVDGVEEFDTPDWAQEFILLVDTRVGKDVCASEALAALAEAEKAARGY